MTSLISKRLPVYDLTLSYTTRRPNDKLKLFICAKDVHSKNKQLKKYSYTKL